VHELSIRCSGTNSSALQPSDGSDGAADGSSGLSSAHDHAIGHWDATSSRLVDSATLPFVFLLLPQVRAQHRPSMLAASFVVMQMVRRSVILAV
jgi:hypothetical protein